MYVLFRRNYIIASIKIQHHNSIQSNCQLWNKIYRLPLKRLQSRTPRVALHLSASASRSSRPGIRQQSGRSQSSRSLLSGGADPIRVPLSSRAFEPPGSVLAKSLPFRHSHTIRNFQHCFQTASETRPNHRHRTIRAAHGDP